MMVAAKWPDRAMGVLVASAQVASLLLASFVGVARAAPDDGGTWDVRRPLPTRRTEVGGAVLDGRLHVVGRYPGSPAPAGAHEVYDPTTDSWSMLDPLPVDLHHAAAATLNGRLYVVGGWTPDLLPVATLYEYDATENSWQARVPMPTARASVVAIASGGRLYAIGGNQGSGGAGDTGVVEAYDPAADRWDTLPSMPTPRHHAMGGDLGGRLHVVGGRAVGQGALMTTHEAFDPATGAWELLPPLPTGRSGGAAAVLSGRLHVLGGEGGPATFDAHEAFEPIAGAWTALPPMPTARHGLAAGAIGDVLYAASGGPMPGATYSDALEAYVSSPAPGPPPEASACTPRPRVQVSTARGEIGVLDVTVRSGTSGALATNALGAVRLDRATNAAVTFAELPSRDGEAATGQGRSTALPLPATEMRLLVRRVTPGRASQVQLVAYDRCGPWPTFVGGGSSAF